VRADRVPDLLTQAARPLTGAVRAAKETLKDLDAVSDDPAVAVLTRGREFLDRALERVKGVALTGYGAYLERHRVVITAQIAVCHCPRLDRICAVGNPKVGRRIGGLTGLLLVC
jgi:hypothetical protein